MLKPTNKLKWLFSLVLIFGGFAVYTVSGKLAADLATKEYAWILKVIAEFGLFLSVIVSVGFFHHWLIAAEEHKQFEATVQVALAKYVDEILLNTARRGFSGITAKELDFGDVFKHLDAGDYVYWLITFDPRYKHHCREIENAIRNGVHIRMIIIKNNCTVAELRAREITGFDQSEYSQYAKLFKHSLEDIATRIDDKTTGSLGVFVSDGLPCIPLCIIIRNKSKKIQVLSSYYLAEPVGRMPYLKWESTLKSGDQVSFEAEDWNLTDLFYNYFIERWQFAKTESFSANQMHQLNEDNFIFAPRLTRDKCSSLMSDKFI